jgi:prevent-host-death family protein
MEDFMIVKATDLKNNLGKYLRECQKQDVIITSNGNKTAKLSAYSEYDKDNPKINYVDHISEYMEVFKDGPKKVSYEEFLELTEGNEERMEYIDGEVYLLTAPTVRHQKVLGELHIQFYNFFKGKKCIPMLSPFDVTLRRFPEDINVVEPDLLVVCDMEENLNEKDRYMGVPVLVLEILSVSTKRVDLIKKMDLYRASGVGEYWVVDPDNTEITVYLFKDKDINSNNNYRAGEKARSNIFPGLCFTVGDIF